MPSLFWKEIVTCEICSTQTTRNNILRHKKSCSVGTLYCIQRPNFSKKSQNDLNQHFAKKHSDPSPDVTFKCKLCYQEFPGFYAIRQHRNIQDGMQIGSRTRDVGVEHMVGMLRITKWEKSFVLVNISWRNPSLKGRDTKYSITQWKFTTKHSWTRNLIIFSTFWNMQQK